MKLIKHEKLMKPDAMTLSTAPLIVWLDRQTELRIEPGDRAGDVADIIMKEWGVDRTDAVQLATLWFALGERVRRMKGGGWSQTELKMDRNRPYLKITR